MNETLSEKVITIKLKNNEDIAHGKTWPNQQILYQGT